MLRLSFLFTLPLLAVLAGPAAAAAPGSFQPATLATLVLFNLVAGAGLALLLSGLAVALADRLKRRLRSAARRRSFRPPLFARPAPVRVPVTDARMASVRRRGARG